MRYAFEHKGEVVEKGLTARAYVRDNFSWDNAARIASKRLSEIYESRLFSTYSKSFEMDKGMYSFPH